MLCICSSQPSFQVYVIQMGRAQATEHLEVVAVVVEEAVGVVSTDAALLAHQSQEETSDHLVICSARALSIWEVALVGAVAECKIKQH